MKSPKKLYDVMCDHATIIFDLQRDTHRVAFFGDLMDDTIYKQEDDRKKLISATTMHYT